MIRVISFSGGRSSGMMAKIIRDENNLSDIFVFCNTGKEREETLEFVDECDRRFNLNVQWLEYTRKKPFFKVTKFKKAARAGEPFQELIDSKQYLPNLVTRFCTAELKIRTAKRFMKSMGHKNWHSLVGIRYDEPLRWGKMLANTPRKECFYNILPLYERNITIKEVNAFWESQDFKLKLEPHQGNCDFCFMKGKHKTLQLIREDPQRLDWWIKNEQKTGNTFRKNVPLINLKELALSQTELFIQGDLDYPCFCNAD